MDTKNKINNFFDLFSNPEVCIFSIKIPAFLFCGSIGFLIGSIFFVFLSYEFKLKIGISLIIIGICTATFFIFSLLYKILTGKEEYVSFVHLLIAYLSIIFSLILLKQSILPYLDLLSYGIAIFMAIGRIGCLKAGCCYGRPFSWGIIYSNKYRKQGIPGCYINKRLLPIQFIEFILAFLIFSSGVFLILPFHPPGIGLLYYLINYSLIRFFLEFKRGDVIRKYLFLLSLNQWICTLLILFLIILQLFGGLPFSLYIFLYSVFCILCISLIIIKIHLQYHQYKLILPNHILEITSLIDSFPDFDLYATFYTKEDIWLKRTSKGLVISKGIIPGNEKYKINYSLSHISFFLSTFIAKSLIKQIMAIIKAPQNTRMLKGNNGVYHIIL